MTGGAAPRGGKLTRHTHITQSRRPKQKKLKQNITIARQNISTMNTTKISRKYAYNIIETFNTKHHKVSMTYAKTWHRGVQREVPLSTTHAWVNLLLLWSF